MRGPIPRRAVLALAAFAVLNALAVLWLWRAGPRLQHTSLYAAVLLAMTFINGFAGGLWLLFGDGDYVFLLMALQWPVISLTYWLVGIERRNRRMAYWVVVGGLNAVFGLMAALYVCSQLLLGAP